MNSYKSALEDRAKRRPGLSENTAGKFEQAIFQNGPVFWLILDAAIWVGCALLCAGFFHLGNIPFYLPNPKILLIPFGLSLMASWLVGGYDRDAMFLSLRFASETAIAGFVASLLGPSLVALLGNYGGVLQPSRLFLFVIPIAFVCFSLLARRKLWRVFGGKIAVNHLVLLGNAKEEESLEEALCMVGRKMKISRLEENSRDSELLKAAVEQQNSSGQDPASRSVIVVIAPSAAGTLNETVRPYLVALHATNVPVYSWSAFWRERLRMHDCKTENIDWLFDKEFPMSDSRIYWHLKRIIDILISLVCLIISLPVLLIAMLAVIIDSGFPAIFEQTRVGLKGKDFKIYKLRTMRHGAEKDGTTTTKNDSRQTKTGEVLRKLRIDEIPQLINVIKGDMSMIGPRPEWKVCVDQYEKKIPGYHLRHLVKPGITGWAQVNYPYGENVEDAKKKLAFDLHYVSHGSVTLDCSILLKTVYVLAGRVGSR